MVSVRIPVVPRGNGIQYIQADSRNVGSYVAMQVIVEVPHSKLRRSRLVHAQTEMEINRLILIDLQVDIG